MQREERSRSGFWDQRIVGGVSLRGVTASRLGTDAARQVSRHRAALHGRLVTAERAVAGPGAGRPETKRAARVHGPVRPFDLRRPTHYLPARPVASSAPIVGALRALCPGPKRPDYTDRHARYTARHADDAVLSHIHTLPLPGVISRVPWLYASICPDRQRLEPILPYCSNRAGW